MYQSIQFKTILFVIPCVLACFSLSPRAQAVTPAPDGGYPGGNTAEGHNALSSLSTGGYNAAIGYFSLFDNTTGSYNTALGAGALDLNTASNNTAVGAAALLLNTTGTENVAVGIDALALNDSTPSNTAVGAFALYNNTSDLPGGFNTAIGDRTLLNNTTGFSNVAVGTEDRVVGNSHPGAPALFSNTMGSLNVAVGGGALYSNTEGGGNTAIGTEALQFNIQGFNNVAVGDNALNNNTGSNNVALGNLAGSAATFGSNNIYIGYHIDGTADESNACYIGSIFDATSSNGVAVLVNSNGRLGTTTSSRRFKEEIKPMDQASGALFSLKPISFRYKKEIDPAGTSQFGLVAEDVEKVNPALVVRDKEGKPYSVRYDQVNAMLLNEFLKEHKKVEQQDCRIREQETMITQLKNELQATTASQQKQIETLTAGLQKVSAQIEVSKPAPQTVNNP